MKKIIAIFLCVAICWIFYQRKMTVNAEKPVLGEYKTSKNVSKIQSAIDEINAQNAEIKTYSCQSFGMELFVKNSKFDVVGDVYLEKDKRFHMVITSKLGKELDAGSNEKSYWFWSKRIEPNYNYQDRKKVSQFKSYINPDWLILCMNFNKIETKNVELIKYKSFYGLIEHRDYGKVLSLIDPFRKLVVGHYLYDIDDKLIASAEISEFQTKGDYTIPKTMDIVMYQENITIKCHLLNATINPKLKPENWITPRSFSQ